MFAGRCAARICRVSVFLCASRRHLLGERFALSEEWRSRHDAFRELGIEGGYEWIAAVQKKFVSAGIASAVDVDAAVCTAEELDQLDDVLKIVYRLRHTENTGQMLPSTEYALVRLLLKHQCTGILLAILDDPINYGIFLNEHSACLLIDHFLEVQKINEACRAASFVMLQELFQSALLNWLCIYSALKWTELPAEQRVFEKLSELKVGTGSEGDANNVEDDEDERIFKFPYLKNEYNDRHFDLVDPYHLVGKCLLWFANHVPLSDEEVGSIRFIGSVFYGDYDLAKQLLQTTKISSAAIAVCRSRLGQVETSIDVDKEQAPGKDNADLKMAIDKMEEKNAEEKISDRIMEHLKKVQSTEEEKLMNMQRSEFRLWRQNRIDLVKAQVEQLDATLRLKEISEERQKLRDRWEMLNFFENRLRWEDVANVKEQLLSGDQGKSKSKEDLEQEYVDQVFIKTSAQKT